MTNKKWKKVLAAKEMLGLEDQATLKQIKSAYRRLSKQFHPDTIEAVGDSAGDRGSVAMQEINDAYKTLLDFCQNYSYSLVPDETQPLEGQDWWLERFGDDPVWGKKRN